MNSILGERYKQADSLRFASLRVKRILHACQKLLGHAGPNTATDEYV
jgi:hypothetical protein